MSISHKSSKLANSTNSMDKCILQRQDILRIFSKKQCKTNNWVRSALLVSLD